jgi:hypothetical protein
VLALAAYHNMTEKAIMVRVNLTPSTVFLTIKITALAKYYLLEYIYPFTYVCADNTVAAARLVNNAVFSNLDAFKTCIRNTRDNLNEFSRIGVNSAKTFEQTSRDVAHNMSTTYAAGVYRERQERRFQEKIFTNSSLFYILQHIS